MTSDAEPFIHSLADVASQSIGPRTRIWQYVVVLAGARIGGACNVCSHCFIEDDVEIGDRVTVKNGVQIWNGVTLEDDVFVGPNATFTNDRFPRSQAYLDTPVRTVIRRGASLGAGAVILPGVEVGAEAMVGAGAVVTRAVPPHAIVVGNPARIAGYTNTARPQAASRVDADPASCRVRGVSLVDVPVFWDMRGGLSAAEVGESVPFEVRRYFLVFDVPSKETRGAHAHKECHQFLVCVHGSCSLVVDDGTRREEIKLDRPSLGVHVAPMVWGIQYHYSSDAVLLVLASHPYDPADYIRDYGRFRELAGSS